MHSQSLSEGQRDAIRAQVLRAIALNREPGYHFAGNFVDLSYDRLASEEMRLSLDPGPHLLEANGEVNIGAVALLADLALAGSIRAGLDPATRLATVNMHLSFTGAPVAGRLEAQGAFEGFVDGAAGRQGLSRVTLLAGGRAAAFGEGAFMVLKPPKGVELAPVPLRRGKATPTPAIEGGLKRDEAKIVAHTDATLAALAHEGGSFIRRFWGGEPHVLQKGATCTVKNGPHIGNRVGHVQGGVLLGLAATTACAALPPTWMLTGISVWYISPGEGRVLKVKSKIVHHGRLVSVVRTLVTGKGGRRVLEVVTNHAFRSHG
jgi:acyl-coenzyme A thioesterase PaaI-like protein